MISSQIYVKDGILDLAEFGNQRSTNFSLMRFLILCCNQADKTETLACHFGITKAEYEKCNTVSNQITIWMLVIAFATIVSLIVIPSLLGKSTITMIVVVLSLCNAVALLITLHYKRKIDRGLLFHAINYDYVT